MHPPFNALRSCSCITCTVGGAFVVNTVLNRGYLDDRTCHCPSSAILRTHPTWFLQLVGRYHQPQDLGWLLLRSRVEDHDIVLLGSVHYQLGGWDSLGFDSTATQPRHPSLVAFSRPAYCA